MSALASEIYMPGPLHPDLFGGETPMMCRVDPLPRVWLVFVLVQRGRHAWERVEKVVAADAEEAGEIALDRLRRAGPPRNKKLSVDACELLEDEQPLPMQVRRWWAHRQQACEG